MRDKEGERYELIFTICFSISMQFQTAIRTMTATFSCYQLIFFFVSELATMCQWLGVCDLRLRWRMEMATSQRNIITITKQTRGIVDPGRNFFYKEVENKFFFNLSDLVIKTFLFILSFTHKVHVESASTLKERLNKIHSLFKLCRPQKSTIKCKTSMKLLKK